MSVSVYALHLDTKLVPYNACHIQSTATYGLVIYFSCLLLAKHYNRLICLYDHVLELVYVERHMPRCMLAAVQCEACEQRLQTGIPTASYHSHHPNTWISV